MNLGPLGYKYMAMARYDSLGIKFDKNTQQFVIGDSPVTFDGDDIIVKGKRYEADEGLWELLTQTTLAKGSDNKAKYLNSNNYRQYIKIIIDETMACFQDKNPSKPRSSTNYKYIKIIGPELHRRKTVIQKSHSTSELDTTITTGAGIVKFIPDTPKYLINRLYTLVGHKKSGHTIDFSEAFSIIDMLKSRKLISKSEFKNMYEYFNSRDNK
jgi:hypothetical protein